MTETPAEHRVAVEPDGAQPQSVPAPKKKTWRHRVLRLFIILLALYVVWCIALFLFQEYLIFPGTFLRRDGDSVQRPLLAEVLWHDIGGGERVEAWLVPPTGRSAKPAPLVVFAHGNGELIDDWPYVLGPLSDRGCALLLVEYRGYGRSGGRPGEAAIVGDVAAVLERVLQRPDVDAARVAYYGRSIGGGVLAQLAARHRPRAMILESTFTSVTALTHRYLVPPGLLRHPFRSDDVLRSLDVPLLVFHGRRDRNIPISHGRELARIARQAKFIEYDTGHNDEWPDAEVHWATVREFLRETGVVDE